MPLPSQQGQSSVYQSGDWEIDLGRRELRHRGMVRSIGARGFDIITALVQATGKPITKADLMARVWPGSIVSDNTLQVHISGVRKALGEDRQLLKTESGRGYRLAGEWTLSSARRAALSPVLDAVAGDDRTFRTNLPSKSSELIGRNNAVQELSSLLATQRVVVLTGPGGIGKTVLAQELARRLFPDVTGDSLFVELASVSDPALVPSAVASTLGLRFGGLEISASAVAQGVGARKVLLVLDNCEHVIDSVADLTETMTRACPNAKVLATSREVLRIEDEYVYRVAPLDFPASDSDDLSMALEHSAVQLFIARTVATHADLTLNQKNLSIISAICRRLDGIPLALELAATRAGALGLHEVAARLDDRFGFLTSGRRTALPRHQTLQATLAWSYDLLSADEQCLLCHLAIFPAGFRLDAATAVMSHSRSPGLDMVEGLSNLVSKSLVSLDESVSPGRWRLLETTRAYALERLAEAGDAEVVARLRAEFFRDLLAPTAFGRRLRPETDDFARYVEEIDNVRAALDWAFAEGGSTSIGIVLTAAYAPVWTRLSLIVECKRNVDRALESLEQNVELDDRVKMLLTVGLGAALYHCTGTTANTGLVLHRALALAKSVGDDDAQLRAVWVNWSYRYNQGDMRTARFLADRYASLAKGVGDPADSLVGDRLVGTTLHHVGNQASARFHLERVRDHYFAPDDERHTIWLHYDQSVLARSILARVLWLQGFVEQARAMAERCLDDSRSADDKPSICYVLCMSLGAVSLWSGDIQAAELAARQLSGIVAVHGQAFWGILSKCREGQLLVARGNYAEGVAVLSEVLKASDRVGGTTFYSEFHGDLAIGLAGLGQLSNALDTIGQAIARADKVGEIWYIPELLRIKGELLLSSSELNHENKAEDCFRQSIAVAKDHGSLSWELRSSMSMSRLKIKQHQFEEARLALLPVHAKFREGFSTVDLQEAGRILGVLDS
jgi:predicted ATPase/DNA-binding winged helix-turn-helix (wHTH) protein